MCNTALKVKGEVMHMRVPLMVLMALFSCILTSRTYVLFSKQEYNIEYNIKQWNKLGTRAMVCRSYVLVPQGNLAISCTM